MADEQKQTLTSNAVWDLMNKTQALTVATKKHVVCVQTHNSAHHTIHMLAKKKIVACPVLNATDKQEPVGFIQTIDIIGYVLETLGDEEKITAKAIQEFPYNSTTLKDVLAKASSEPVTLNYDTTTLSHFIEIFAAGVHRTALYTQADDDSEQMTAIISQTDIVRFLAVHLGDKGIKEMAAQDLNRVGFKPQDVLTIAGTATMVAAVKKLYASHMSSLVVTDDKGAAIGALTHRAFRGLTSDHYGDLLLPVNEYLKRHAPEMLKIDRISADITFGELVENFSKRHIHHQYIIKDDGSPDGVVSLTDIMRWIISFSMSPEEMREAAKKIQELEQLKRKSAVATPVTLTIRINELKGLPHGLTGSHDVYLLMKFPGARTAKTKVFASTKDPSGQIRVDFSSIDPEQLVLNDDHINSKVYIEAYSQGRFLGDTFLGRHVIKMNYVLDGFGSGKGDVKLSNEQENLTGGSSTAEISFDMYLTPVKE